MGKNLDDSIKNNMIGLIDEATEVLGEINWKPWHKGSKIINKEALKEEICDCLIFILNAGYEAGLTAQNMLDVTYAKQEKNLERFYER